VVLDSLDCVQHEHRGTTYPLPVSDSYLAKDVEQPGFVLGGPIVKDKILLRRI